MIVQMRTTKQAEKVASLTGGVHLSSEDGSWLTRRVEIEDFEAHREEVESVSPLFECYQTDADGGLCQVPSTWEVTAAKFEVEWPSDPGVILSHFGARRFAYNWALAQAKADMDAEESSKWDLATLRKRWNRAKDEVAPWWRKNSKEAYSSGIADLATGLANWRASKSGNRKGKSVGFPRFKSRRTDSGRVRFTTGTMRFEPNRRGIVLPTIGVLCSKENTRRLQRSLASGRARILSMTLSEHWGRLFVSVNYAIRASTPRPVAKPQGRCGVDLGLRVLATIADTDDNIIEIPNPAPLRATLAERRRVGRQMSRRIPGSRGHRAAKTKLAKLDRRAVNIRRDSWHQLTTMLASTYGEVVIEDLNIAAMGRSMGRRAFRRSVSDTALGMFRPMLDYKMSKAGTSLVVTDRWFASSQFHHQCGCRLLSPAKLSKVLSCSVTGEVLDRDANAALNLRDWRKEQQTSPGPVGSSAPVDTQATETVAQTQGRSKKSLDRRAHVRPRSSAVCGEARIKTPQGEEWRDASDHSIRNGESGWADVGRGALWAMGRPTPGFSGTGLPHGDVLPLWRPRTPAARLGRCPL